MAYKTFIFLADTVNGKILEFPKTFYLRCDLVQPLGTEIVRQYNKTECIVAKKVFLIYYAGDVFGSTQFTGVLQFLQYMNNACNPVFCNVLVNGCNLTFNGCNLVFQGSVPERCSVLVNGCNLTLNGCSLNYN